MLVITPFFVIAMGAAVMGAHAHLPDAQIAAGVHVGDLDLGGKSPDEAKPALEQWAARKQAVLLTLRFAPDSGLTKTWRPDAAKLGLAVNVESTLEAAGRAGREDVIGQISHVFSGPKVVQVAPIAVSDDKRLTVYLKRQIAAEVNRKPKSARFVLLGNGGFGTHHEQNGVTVDVDASASAVKQAWASYLAASAAPAAPAAPDRPADPPADGSAAAPADTSTAAAQPQSQSADGPEAVLAAKIVLARLTAAELEQINTVLGAKSSYVNGTPARLGNIRIAAGHINGTLLKPGDIFSYNAIVGPRGEDGGYREAPILIRGRHDKGIAGGICQTSGTLFNAVLHSGLQIVEREHHSTPIGYLPVGLDATVSYGSLDFKFRNDTGAPVYVAAGLKGRTLTFTLFGKQVEGRHVSLYRGAYSRTGPSYDTEIDRSKPVGYRRVVEPGAGGCYVTWTRIVKVGARVVHHDVISSRYSPHPGVMVIGARPRPRPARRAPAASAAAPVAPAGGAVQTQPAPPPGTPRQ
jgi:vancomycin resistance protein YoaR